MSVCKNIRSGAGLRGGVRGGMRGGMRGGRYVVASIDTVSCIVVEHTRIVLSFVRRRMCDFVLAAAAPCAVANSTLADQVTIASLRRKHAFWNFCANHFDLLFPGSQPKQWKRYCDSL
jgi:hypothetical protein